MRARDFHYDLPEELIAQTPAERRDGSRLLHVTADAAADHVFADVAGLLPENALVVFNDTRVLPARLHTRKATGGKVELLLLEPAGAADRLWRCLAKSSKPVRVAAELSVADDAASLRVVEGRAQDGTVVVQFPAEPYALIERHGEVPLPPYIERAGGASAADRERYQTVYARTPGAVAAPTAGLHFTEPLLAQLRSRGMELAYVTLHVGWGTFAPVRSDDLSAHVMHAERYTVPERTARLVDSGRPVVAVGTTTVSALESFAASAQPDCMQHTDLFITPGYRFRVVDKLITNFHLPGSTLLMMVSAFSGRTRILDAYRTAVARRYRFYSYGDAMLLSRQDTDGHAD